jgi:hypothetical protein
VDANRNYDLTDDEAVEVPKRIKRDDGVIIKIKRTYEGPPARGPKKTTDPGIDGQKR